MTEARRNNRFNCLCFRDRQIFLCCLFIFCLFVLLPYDE